MFGRIIMEEHIGRLASHSDDHRFMKRFLTNLCRVTIKLAASYLKKAPEFD